MENWNHGVKSTIFILHWAVSNELFYVSVAGKFNWTIFSLLKTSYIRRHYGFHSLQRGSGFPTVIHCTQISIERYDISNLAFQYFLGDDALKVPHNGK